MPTTRIPNFWHLFLFLGITVFGFLVAAAFGYTLMHRFGVSMASANQLAQAVAYVVAIGMAWFVFPLVWQEPFLAGLSWKPAGVRPGLVLLGLLVGFIGQGLTVFIPHPRDLPIDSLFKNHALIWFLAFFGVVLGPLFEEIVFRGFLLPAIAIAVDYLRLPRDPDPAIALEHLDAWRASTSFSNAALITSTVVTSLVFALLHAPQLGYTWAAVALLASVSVVLCIVRVRTGSVAASSVVHMSYNLSVFITLFLATGGFRHLDRV